MQTAVIDNLHTIGEVARLSGVPVKTIRYYSDIGLLPPSNVTEAGYRLYSDADIVRLELVRTLRAVNFDLPTISRLLQGEVRPADALELQLGAIEVQMRALKRQRSVLKATLLNVEKGEEAMLAHMKGANSLAQLERLEREAFLKSHLDRGLEGLGVDPAWKAAYLYSAISDLPEEMNEAQFEAWLELAALMSGEDFLSAVREQSRPFWEAVEGNFDMEAWQATQAEIFQAAMQAVRDGRSPEGEDEQRLVEEWLGLHARAVGQAPDAGFERTMLEGLEREYDPGAQRFWELVGIIRQTEDHVALYTRAFYWLKDGLRHRVARL
ncbi:MAG TPA: MerR family transcriptional regulator [Chloroflexia bacterium]|jgi:DNA-binding transcriptional MerR regulator